MTTNRRVLCVSVLLLALVLPAVDSSGAVVLCKRRVYSGAILQTGTGSVDYSFVAGAFGYTERIVGDLRYSIVELSAPPPPPAND